MNCRFFLYLVYWVVALNSIIQVIGVNGASCDNYLQFNSDSYYLNSGQKLIINYTISADEFGVFYINSTNEFATFSMLVYQEPDFTSLDQEISSLPFDEEFSQSLQISPFINSALYSSCISLAFSTQNCHFYVSIVIENNYPFLSNNNNTGLPILYNFLIDRALSADSTSTMVESLALNNWNYYLINILDSDLTVIIGITDTETPYSPVLNVTNLSNIGLSTETHNEFTSLEESSVSLYLGYTIDQSGTYLLGICNSGYLNQYSLSITPNSEQVSDNDVVGSSISILGVIAIVIVIFLLLFIIMSCIAKRRRTRSARVLLQAARDRQMLQLSFLHEQLQRASEVRTEAYENKSNQFPSAAYGNINEIHAAIHMGNRLSLHQGNRNNQPNISIHIVYNAFLRNQLEIAFRESINNPNINNNNNNNNNDKGVTSEELEELPLIHYKLGLYNVEDSKCSICVTDYIVDQTIRQLRCQHHFCSVCIDIWLQTHRACPLCRQDVLTANNKFTENKINRNKDSVETGQLIQEEEKKNNDNDHNTSLITLPNSVQNDKQES